MSKIGRNEPCPCGSGKKYKKCCIGKKKVQNAATKTVSKADKARPAHAHEVEEIIKKDTKRQFRIR